IRESSFGGISCSRSFKLSIFTWYLKSCLLFKFQNTPSSRKRLSPRPSVSSSTDNLSEPPFVSKFKVNGPFQPGITGIVSLNSSGQNSFDSTSRLSPAVANLLLKLGLSRSTPSLRPFTDILVRRHPQN